MMAQIGVMEMNKLARSPLGYAWLIRHYQVNPMPYFVESWASSSRRTEMLGRRQQEFYPASRYKLSTVFEHLEFALKREGLHLQLLRTILPQISSTEMSAYVAATPTGVFARRLAYLYESFTGSRLDLPDLNTGNYILLADPELYFTGPARPQRRWRVTLNLLHDLEFSPMLRKTSMLWPPRDEALQAHCQEITAELSPEMLQRAARYLYTKETRTSYEIEKEVPSQFRTERFIALLQRAGSDQFLSLPGLLELQNAIVGDARFFATAWRDFQNYVGTSSFYVSEVHLVPPRPEDIKGLMEAWLAFSQRIIEHDEVPAVAAAAMVSWLFVYFHPFEDGNGRLHRFLLHHVLAKRGFGPSAGILPVSAVLLRRAHDYDLSLESLSVPLKERSEYTLDEEGEMRVSADTLEHFRYLDCTELTEAVYDFVAETIDKDVPSELRFLRDYDAARSAMRDVLDLPEKLANQFLRYCFQNNGKLSKSKRPQFAKLTDDEISRLEEAIAQARS
jgi:fido (protein-threonine AMPylation protein)